MINTICYIHNTPILKSYKKRNGYEYLLKKGYKVIALDISPIVNKIAFENVTKDLLNDTAIVTKVCFSIKEFISFMKNLNPVETMAIPYFDFKLDYYFVFRCLSKFNIPYSLIHRVNSEAKMPGMSKNRIISYIKNLSFHSIMNSVLIRIPKRLLPIKKARYFFIGGKENFDYYASVNMIDSTTEIVYSHALNYEECISLVENLSIKDKYVVFLDQYMPFHPDHIELGIKIDADKYYGELEKLMKFIEEEYGYRVIIAEHPKANYEQTKYFKNYQKIKFHSVELVKNAKFVIGNFSTALSYCPFFKKNVLICNTDCFKPYNYFTRRIDYWSNILGVTPIDLSNFFDKSKLKSIIEKNIDVEKYKSCLQYTMKADFDWDCKKQSFWDIFLERIMNYDKKL